jgi:transposase
MERVRDRHPDTSEVVVLIEAGNLFWVRTFAQVDATVCVVDPKQVHHFAKSLSSSGAKDDRRDARVLVEFGVSRGHRLEPTDVDVHRETLLELSRGHERLTNQLVKVKQRIRAVLQQSMPEVSAAIRKLETRWCQRLLSEAPTPWHMQRLSLEDFDRCMGRATDETRTHLWQAIQRVEASWMTRAVAKIQALVIQQHLEQFELLQKQLNVLDRELDEATKPLPERARLESVAGIGLIQATAVALHAFSAPPKSRDSAGIRMGVCPVFRGSAEDRRGRKKGHARFRRSANSSASKAGYLLGRLASQHLRWAKAMYADGRSRGQSAATAYRRVARSLLRILTALVRTGQDYNEDRYIQVLKARAVPWAMAL